MSLKSDAWYDDHAASGWRQRMFVGGMWELIAYEDGDWEVRGPPIGCALEGGHEADVETAKERALLVYGALKMTRASVEAAKAQPIASIAPKEG